MHSIVYFFRASVRPAGCPAGRPAARLSGGPSGRLLVHPRPAGKLPFEISFSSGFQPGLNQPSVPPSIRPSGSIPSVLSCLVRSNPSPRRRGLPLARVTWTFGRLDIGTSGRLDVRTSGRLDVRTSGRPDVRMSGRPAVWTSRRPDVQTPERSGNPGQR